MLWKLRKILIYSLMFVTDILGIALSAFYSIEFSEMDKTKYHVMLICTTLCFVVPVLPTAMAVERTVQKQEKNLMPLTALVAMALMS